MVGLRKALSTITGHDEHFVVEAPEGWTQGRTLYGGITAALCAEVSLRRFPGLPPLRSAQFAFIGPASGTLRLEPQLLRQGRSATITSVDCYAGDNLAARAIFTYGATRESRVAHDFAQVPEVPAPDTSESLHGAGTPGFFHNFDIRLAAGERHLSGSKEPWMLAWVRHRDDEGVDPAVSFLALADALPPAAMITLSEPAPISTMTWHVDLCEQPPAQPGSWFLLRTSSEHAAEGYSQQIMEAWDNTGTRIATGHQTVAIFG